MEVKPGRGERMCCGRMGAVDAPTDAAEAFQFPPPEDMLECEDEEEGVGLSDDFFEAFVFGDEELITGAVGGEGIPI